MRRWSIAAVVIAVLSITTGCTAGSTNTPGPLALGGEEGEYCIGTDGETMTVGDIFSVTESDETTLESVSLLEPQGVELDGSFIAPVESLAFGIDSYPPTSPLWDEREEVAGAHIEPDATYTFILVLRPTGDGPHTAKGFEVTYSDAGVTHRKANTTGYVLQEDCIS